MAKRIVFTETGEVRVPRRGEWYDCGACGYLLAGTNLELPCRIYTRTEETIPDPPKPRQVVWVEAGPAPNSVSEIMASVVRGVDFCTFSGRRYRRVEVPTKAEMLDARASFVHQVEFDCGVKWLADKLGIKIE